MVISQVTGGDVFGIISRLSLILLRLVLFSLALGLTIISYQAYSAQGTKRLESAFIGFAFISMGVALSMLNSQATSGITNPTDGLIYMFQIAETLPFIIGFAMLYLSLYR